MTSSSTKDQGGAWLLLVLPAAALLLWAGWTLQWFQCDDAYISFRYISNRHDGWGYTWNPPPFRPVEGYTSFLWIVLLDAIWTWWGVEPPDAATVLGLYCALGSVFVTAAMTWQVPWSPSWRPYRPALVAMVLLATLTNRTFVTWTSSGLETPLVVLLLLLWTWTAVFARRGPGWSFALFGVATLLTLTRPDGLLFLGGTAAVVWAARRPAGLRWPDLVGVAPVGLVLAHLVWRHHTYGYWLPNTWYAKDIGWWPSAGINYLTLFGLEYAFVLWVPLIAWVGWTQRRHLRDRAAWAAHAATWLAVASLVGQVAYYVLRVGGDHFEFRIFAHLPPLLFVLGMWALDRLALAPRRALLVAHTVLPLTWIIAWTDWYTMRDITADAAISKLRVRIADVVPLPFKPWAFAHDELQGWLVYRSVCVSQQTHKWFAVHKHENLPTRAESLAMFPREVWDAGATGKTAFPITAIHSVGVAGWTMPHVAILDRLGLNDLVVARTGVAEHRMWRMAHTRRPPEGYIECFDPDVSPYGRFKLHDRDTPMTVDRIRACEDDWVPRADAGLLVAPDPIETDPAKADDTDDAGAKGGAATDGAKVPDGPPDGLLPATPGAAAVLDPPVEDPVDAPLDAPGTATP